MALDVTYSVVRLTMRYRELILSIASGFLFLHDHRLYLVTAWHNFSGRHSEELTFLDTKTSVTPNNVVVDFPIKSSLNGSYLYSRIPIVLELERDGSPTYFVHSQTWPRVDVCVLEIDYSSDQQAEVHLSDGSHKKFRTPIAPPTGSSKFCTPSLYNDKRSGWDQHDVGDELFIVGYPLAISDDLANPIWKRASIAVEYDRGWFGTNRFLVDSATRKGLSGGLAIYYSKRGDSPSQSFTTLGDPYYVIHGVYVGRLGDSEVEAQLGSVWKSNVIEEIIESRIVPEHPDILELGPTPIREAIQKRIDGIPDINALKENQYLINALISNLMQDLDGRANPNKVRDIVRECLRDMSSLA